MGHVPGTGKRHEESPTAAHVLLQATEDSTGLGERTTQLLAVASEKVRPVCRERVSSRYHSGGRCCCGPVEEKQLCRSTVGPQIPPLQGLATALCTRAYRNSKRKPILCLLPCHPPRLFSSALPEFIQNQESIKTALRIWSVQPATAI